MTEVNKPVEQPVEKPVVDPANPEPKPADPTPSEKKDEDKTADELAAEAEAIEAELKANGDKGKQTPDQIRANQLRRLQKAREKRDALNNEPDADDKKSEIAVEDLVTLEVQGIEKGSDKAKILERYVKGGIVKTYKEALNHVGVKAEIEALDASTNAKTVIDENDTDENQLKTKKEAIAGYRASGEVPDDPEMRKALAEDNVSRMSSLN